MYSPWEAEERRRIMDVVDIDVAECSAEVSRVEGMGHLSLEVGVVTRGILRVVPEQHAHPAEPRQALAHLLEHGRVQHRDGLEDIETTLLCECDEFPRLRERTRKGLLHDDVLARLERLFAVREMRAVHEADVDRVNIRLGEQRRVVGVDRRDAVLRGERRSLRAAVRTREDGLPLDGVNGLQRDERVSDDPPCPNQGKFHDKFLFSHRSINDSGRSRASAPRPAPRQRRAAPRRSAARSYRS